MAHQMYDDPDDHEHPDEWRRYCDDELTSYDGETNPDTGIPEEVEYR